MATAESPRDDVDRVERDWRRERPDTDVSSIGVVSRIWRIGRHPEQQRKEQLDAVGADHVGRGVAAADKLERAGLVTRHVLAAALTGPSRTACAGSC